MSISFQLKSNIPEETLSYNCLKLKLAVAAVTYFVMKTTITCSPMVSHLFDTAIVVSTYKRENAGNRCQPP